MNRGLSVLIIVLYGINEIGGNRIIISSKEL